MLIHSYVHLDCNHILPSSHYIIRNAQTCTVLQGEVPAEKHGNIQDVVTTLRRNFREEKYTTANAHWYDIEDIPKSHSHTSGLHLRSVDRLVIAYLQLFQRELTRNGSSPSCWATRRSGVGSFPLTTLTFNYIILIRLKYC